MKRTSTQITAATGGQLSSEVDKQQQQQQSAKKMKLTATATATATAAAAAATSSSCLFSPSEGAATLTSNTIMEDASASSSSSSNSGLTAGGSSAVATKRISSLSSLSNGGWSALPSDWFGHISEYLYSDEFYAAISCCRSWRANEQRIPPLAFSIAISDCQMLIGQLVGVSQRYRHIQEITTWDGVHIDAATMLVLFYHFPSVTSLQCTIDINDFDSELVASLPHFFKSLRSLSLTLTMELKEHCECHYDYDQAEKVPWDKVRDLLECLISKHRGTLNSISLKYDFSQCYQQHLSDCHLEVLGHLSKPSQLTHLSITSGLEFNGFGRMNDDVTEWPEENIAMIKSFKNLISLTLPQLMYHDVAKLFARPISWRRLKTLSTPHGGSHELERYLEQCQTKTGWPQLMPVFDHDPLSEDQYHHHHHHHHHHGAEEEEKKEGHIEAWFLSRYYYGYEPAQGQVDFPKGWAEETSISQKP